MVTSGGAVVVVVGAARTGMRVLGCADAPTGARTDVGDVLGHVLAPAEFGALVDLPGVHELPLGGVEPGAR